MARQPNLQITENKASSKRDLQRQIGRTRESLGETVDEIKKTAKQGIASVKETVSDVMDYREEFQKEPLVWSLGALSAGFALGYTVGFAHKSAKKGKPSKVTQFADRMVDGLATVGQSLVIPGLNTKITELFGMDFSGLLSDMRGKKDSPRKLQRVRPLALKSGAKKGRAKKAR
jgi:hypothetical protein